MRTREQEVARYTWLSTAEAGRRMGALSPDKVRDEIAAGRLRARNVGTPNSPEYRMKPEWVEAWEKARDVNPEAAA